MHFCVETGRLLSFIVSKDGIHIDPLKIVAIVSLPPPTNIMELQSLQGKENFLHRFECNFIEKNAWVYAIVEKYHSIHLGFSSSTRFQQFDTWNYALSCIAPPQLIEILSVISRRLHYYHQYGLSAGR